MRVLIVGLQAADTVAVHTMAVTVHSMVVGAVTMLLYAVLTVGLNLSSLLFCATILVNIFAYACAWKKVRSR